MSVLTYSTTPGSNGTALASGGSLAEGATTVASVNDKMRQILADVAMFYGDSQTGVTTGGTASAYTVSTASGHGSYANSMAFRIRAHVDCAGGATTMNVNSLGVKALKVFGTSGVRDPRAGEIKQDMVYDCAYVTALNCIAITGHTIEYSVFGASIMAAADAAAVRTLISAQLSDADLTAIAALSGTGLAVRTAADTWANRQITSANGTVAITNPAGVAGDIDVSVSGARALLATKTASASANLSFTEFNNAVYRLYEFELENVKPATDSVTFLMRTSTNGGAAYDQGASDYTWGMNGTGSGSSQAGANSAASSIAITDPSILVGNAASEYGVSGRLTLFNAPSAVPAEVAGFINYWRDTSEFFRYSVGGCRFAATDVDAVRFLFTSGNIASGRIKMFGII